VAKFKMAFDRSSPASARSRPEAFREKFDLSAPEAADRPADAATLSNLSRPVFCVLGMPIDAVSIATVVEKIEAAAASRSAFLLSTPNLNFLVNSLSDPEFRETLLASDLCPPDGFPIVCIAWLLGLPIKERAAGADLLDRLQIREASGRRLRVFLFGGAPGVASAAARTLNARSNGLNCVGTLDPGFCDVSEMSQDSIIQSVNSSGADFLVASLGAKKGQLWLQRNHNRLTIPIRSHLGAAINFQAGVISRAPRAVRAWGLEWLWRIKEERYLWTRYRDDGFVLLRLLVTRVLPLAVIFRWHRFSLKHQRDDLLVNKNDSGTTIKIALSGVALESHVPKAIPCFQEAISSRRNITIDLSNLRQIDARFLGLLLMLRKELRSRGAKLTFTGVPRRIRRIFWLSELEFLLSVEPS
jgi:N-acetylglucosaminyldiphosphoundecaprenol N-acetyl-beta-D-mannosaminyltransferase